MQTLSINSKDLDKLKSLSLAELSQILKAGIIKLAQITINSYPITNIHAYLYLHHLKQQSLKQEIDQFIDRILMYQGNIQNHEGDNQTGDSLVLLDDQIIQLISQINPFIIFNYCIQYKGKWMQSNHKSVIIKQKNEFGRENIIKLCMQVVNNQFNSLNLEQNINLAKYILLPAYFGNGYFNYKGIQQAIKSIIRQQRSHHIKEQLSHLFVLFYHAYWSHLILDNTNRQHVVILQNQLTLLQITHSSIPYPQQLLESQLFLQHIKRLLLYKGENKSSIHPLCIKVYEKIASSLNQLNDAALTFIKLFNILSCYGSHLIKDVWSSFYVLVQSQQKSVFQAYELIDIILTKLQSHENSNVIKNCLHQLLKNQNSNRIFERTPSIIYSSLIGMLNLGVHYLDCMFHMDSKMYELISSFFLRYFNSKQLNNAQLMVHLNWLIEAIATKSNFDHATIALVLIFEKQQEKTTFLTVPILQKTKDLLSSAYNRFPIRKRFQLVDSVLSLIHNNINKELVTINYIISYLVNIHQEYLMTENKKKIKNILLAYGVQELNIWVEQAISQVMQGVRTNIQLYNESYNVEELYCKIKMIEFYHSICGYGLKEYYQYCSELIIQFSQSQYKSIGQRKFIIRFYSIIKDNLIRQLNHSSDFTPHLEAILNSIVFYVQLSHQHGQEEQYGKAILGMIYDLYHRAYAYIEGQAYKQRERERVILARMLQWASDKLSNYKIALPIIVTACRARIQVLQQVRNKPNLYMLYENLFEETLYELYNQLQQLQTNGKKANRCCMLSKDKQLRLRVLLITILMNDSSHRISNNPLNCSDIGDIIDRYDFQSYEETCWMIESIYCSRVNVHLKGQQEASGIVRQLELLLENMIQNLQYSLSKKEIMAICQCTVTLMFKFAYSSGSFSQSFIQFLLKLIKCGQNYLIFQRVVALQVTKQLFHRFDQVCELNCQKLIPLLVAILSTEQYRGFDSAVYLYKQNMEDQLYRQFNMSLQANYQGAVPRFLLTFAFKKILSRPQLSNRNMIMLSQLIHESFEICMQLVVKQKMFLSGKNKLKLQMWQFLLVFSPPSLISIVGKAELQTLLVRCVDCIGHNLISQIRYYSQMFLMRIVTNKQCFALISNELLQALQCGFLKSIGNINRTISYIIVSGILINHISQFESQPHFARIGDGYVALYNCLLTYVGSSVAYFRGLTQFFCLSKITNCLQTKYVSILRQNFLLDTDAKSLIQKLAQIMNEYICDINNWQIERQILRIIPNQNFNVICTHYYMDILKQFSTELAKINKNLDGFTAYRYIWKKHAATQEDQEDEQEQEKKDEQEEQQIFQRKIDPTLDYLYGQQHHSKLKLMVTSSKSQVLIGHLARTGEIFGIEQLIVPSAKIVQSDQFKSISVTAERWLNISDLGVNVGDRVKQETIIKALIRYKSQGFQIVKLSKRREQVQGSRSIDMDQRCVLLLDEQQILSGECLKLIDEQMQIGRHLSLHVQTSIFIWSYFKKYVN